MRTAVVAGLLAFVALAGCVSEEPVEHGPRKLASEDADPFNDRNSTLIAQPGPQEQGEDAPEANEPPVAHLSADTENGTVPFNVTFTLEGTDPDGDPLSWTFDADGDGVEEANGTVLPGEFTFSFTEAGLYKASLNLSDGLQVADTTLFINATAAGGVENEGPEPVVMSGISVGSPIGCAVGDPLYHYFDAALAGFWHFTVEATAANGVGTEWWAGDSSAGTLGTTGVIPEGADNVAVYDPLAPLPAEYTITLHHPDFPPA